MAFKRTETTALQGANVLGGILSPFFGDLAVIRTQTHPRGKRRPPVDLELHLNPASLGAAFVGAGLGLWLMQLRIHPTVIDEMRTVVDVPAVPDRTELTEVTIPIYENVQVYPQQESMTAAELTAMGIPRPWGMSRDEMRLVRYETTTQSHHISGTPAVTHEEPTGNQKLHLQIDRRNPFAVDLGNLVESLNPIKGPLFGHGPLGGYGPWGGKGPWF